VRGATIAGPLALGFQRKTRSHGASIGSHGVAWGRTGLAWARTGLAWG
jgi:hypothetical protein